MPYTSHSVFGRKGTLEKIILLVTIVSFCFSIGMILQPRKKGLRHPKKLYSKDVYLVPREIEKMSSELSGLPIDDSAFYQYNYTIDNRGHEYQYTGKVINGLQLRLATEAFYTFSGTSSFQGIGQSTRITDLLDSTVKVRVEIKKLGKQTAKITPMGYSDFFIDDTMLVDDPQPALLVLYSNSAIQPLASELADSLLDKNRIDQKNRVSISSEMMARLVDPGGSNFFIFPQGDSIKQVDIGGKEYTAWEWLVKPKKEGRGKIFLNLLKKTGTGKMSDFIPVKEISIYVYSEKKNFWGRLIDFWNTEWKWIVTSLASIFVFWLGFLRERKKRQVPDPY